MPDVTVLDAPEASRYELHVAGQLAGFAAYRRTPEHVEFVHTEIDPAFEGQGLGRRLAAAALDDVRAKGGRVVATCPFIAAFVKRHPEYEEILA